MMRASAPVAAAGSADTSDAALASRLRLVIGRLGRELRKRQVGGLTSSQLSALSTIDRYGPIRLGDLACRERVSPPTLTPCVASLERLALVERRPDPDDRRSALMVASPGGKRLLEDIRRERNAILACKIGELGSTDRQALAAALSALEQIVGDEPSG